jgi:glutamate N-acetyltransferase/amino-acid N-acetyltransferase
MHLFTSKFLNKPKNVRELPGSVTTPAGFRATGVAAGIKRSGNLDLGLLVSDSPCAAASVFTTNAAAAAPVRVVREETDRATLQGLVVNSGSANACTGERGLTDARKMAELAASATGLSAAAMAVASTGVIGTPLPMEKVAAGIGAAADALSDSGGGDFAAAIQTTDRIDKVGAVEVELEAGSVRVGVCAKGAGMIAPNMATMLAFITTDAALEAGALQEMLDRAVAVSFNAVSVDGDMSTNDSLFLLANGAGGVRVERDGDDFDSLGRAVEAVCMSMALKMVADGEGASRTIELNVKGAAGAEEAARVAAAVATSSLVRTAFYGRDANWGRIMASAGAALNGERQLAADITFEDILLAEGGAAAAEEPEPEALRAVMGRQEISVTLDLHRGDAGHTMYFSDLTHDYVTLNADYTT